MKKIDIKPLLALLAVAGFFGCIWAVLTAPADLPAAIKDLLLILVGALVTLVKDIYGYYFGSSEGSARKTELLNTAVALGPEVPAAGEEVSL